MYGKVVATKASASDNTVKINSTGPYERLPLFRLFFARRFSDDEDFSFDGVFRSNPSDPVRFK